ncbi:heme-dependent oxidative N-demethylase family protein [Pseudooceanicola sp.]|uniref:heme-dependent oxidative N-demethylase family protein n=1 Tax=Pseudooceanicola sp. TaxID=1914328 RepID=UPI004059D737
MTSIFQSRLPYADADRRPLPGIQPLDPAEWLIADDAFAGQMTERARLLAEVRDKVVALLPAGRDAADELLEEVLRFAATRPGYAVGGAEVRRPDGVTVALDRDDPLGTLGLLVQEDLCLLEKPEGAEEHVLTGAVLCFPSAWTLSQKIGRPLMRIHKPVEEYDEGIGRRVQRLFDGVQVGRPLWRFNWLPTDDTSLFRPKLEFADKIRKPGMEYLRSERQTILRLPRTRAVVFGIHTYMVRRPE